MKLSMVFDEWMMQVEGGGAWEVAEWQNFCLFSAAKICLFSTSWR